MNRQILLAARPVGLPRESDFRLVQSQRPTPGPGEILVRTHYLSVDPYMRGRIAGVKTYVDPAGIGEVMQAEAAGEIVQSDFAGLAAGDYVAGFFGWQEYAVARGDAVRKLDPSLAPISTSLGVLGMPGLTAYFGLLEIGKPNPGETVVVSSAAGAVGSLAGQIAKIKKCRAVGIAGNDDKINYITRELGFDGGFNYKTAGDYDAELKRLCPEGIDVYFDNVGGPVTDAVIRHMNVKARIVVCGQISQYNAEGPEMGPRWMFHLIIKRARAEGFLVFQFAERYAEGLAQMVAWLRERKLKYREQIVEGIENTPRAFIDMLCGANTGKQLVRVA